jgi:protein-S-isoprenylcysteine O-methyltransferase Ste14
MSLDSKQIYALAKTAIFIVVVPGIVAFYVPLSLVGPEHQWNDLPLATWQYLGVLPFVAGIATALWCGWDFAVTGLGTPVPIDAPRVLVVRGMYRYVRNPMYAGVLSVILGFVLWFASGAVLIYFACLWLAFHLFVALYEEPHLRRIFGAQYEAYCRKVNRWLPRLPSK